MTLLFGIPFWNPVPGPVQFICSSHIDASALWLHDGDAFFRIPALAADSHDL